MSWKIYMPAGLKNMILIIIFTFFHWACLTFFPLCKNLDWLHCYNCIMKVENIFEDESKNNCTNMQMLASNMKITIIWRKVEI